MLVLDGLLNMADISAVKYLTGQRFKDASKLIAPEALILYEEGFLDNDVIRALCEKKYGIQLHEPINSYVPDNIVMQCAGTGYVPVVYEPMRRVVTVLYVPDFECSDNIEVLGHHIEKLPTTLGYYLKLYQKYYGMHQALNEMPAKALFDNIIEEAIGIGAIDITISSVGQSTRIYYNVKKTKVDSRKVYGYDFIYDVVKLLTIKSPMDRNSRKPKHLDYDLTKEYRGRVVINTTVAGYSITIRLLPNFAFDTSLEELNVKPSTAKWLRDEFLGGPPGLRVVVGATMSGKNTTLLALLREAARTEQYKIVSIEMPVEQVLDGVEQISVETDEEFAENVKSFIRMNPDIVYITEIRDDVGLAAIQLTNTGKCVYATLHANSVADVISRLVDITGLTQDRVIQSLHAVCYQELRKSEDGELYPYDRYLRFDNRLKYQLYGKSLGDVVKLIESSEEGD